MSKKILNTTISDYKQESTEVSPQKTKSLSDKVVFSPTASQARLKAKFWTRFRPSPLAPSDNIAMATALEVTGSAQIRKWWNEPGFVEWFTNKEEERERLKYLFHKGLDTIENILDNPEANANAKANLIKMLAEMNGYLGKKPVERFADEAVNKMSEDQLKEFLRQSGVRLVEEKVIDASPSKEK
jgi:hypothetical protein